MKQWNTMAVSRRKRLDRGLLVTGRIADPSKMTALLEAVIEPGDRVCIEGNNQKQADFLARALVQANPAVLHDLHILQSVLAVPEHLDIFEKGIASKLDFSFSNIDNTGLMVRMMMMMMMMIMLATTMTTIVGSLVQGCSG